MPHAKVYIHFVWTTKNRIPFLDTLDLRKKLWIQIKENAKVKGIFIDAINGYQEHCHCLVSLGIDQSMSKVMQLVKGESSHWMNNHQMGKHKFEWQACLPKARYSKNVQAPQYGLQAGRIFCCFGFCIIDGQSENLY